MSSYSPRLPELEYARLLAMKSACGKHKDPLPNLLRICYQAEKGGRSKLLILWWTWSGSNRRPLPCHGSALPAAPQAHFAEGRRCTRHQYFLPAVKVRQTAAGRVNSTLQRIRRCTRYAGKDRGPTRRIAVASNQESGRSGKSTMIALPSVSALTEWRARSTGSAENRSEVLPVLIDFFPAVVIRRARLSSAQVTSACGNVPGTFEPAAGSIELSAQAASAAVFGQCGAARARVFSQRGSGWEASRCRVFAWIAHSCCWSANCLSLRCRRWREQQH